MKIELIKKFILFIGLLIIPIYHSIGIFVGYKLIFKKIDPDKFVVFFILYLIIVNFLKLTIQ